MIELRATKRYFTSFNYFFIYNISQKHEIFVYIEYIGI